MTKQIKNKRLAKFLGWTRNREINGCWNDPQGIVHACIPDFFADLNAIHKAINSRKFEFRDTCATALFDMMRAREQRAAGGLHEGNEAWGVRVAYASAKDHAECLGQVIGLWKKGQ